ncbi:MAG TPA: hypothetical protein VNO70_15405 [Blastocatellia bacterium]|nr:hypothetical protein [Blastocatellia bacterium]
MKGLALFSRLASLLLMASALVIAPSLWADDGPEHQESSDFYGVSGGNVNDISRRFCCSGTLGSLVRDSSGALHILSNNHVLARSGRASLGEDISQPGLIDNGCRVAEVVADLSAAPSLSSNVDAAIARLRSGAMRTDGAILDIGTISSAVRSPAIGLAVQKSGRTTGHTTGSITSINATVSVRYPKSCGSGGGTVHTFTNQVVVGQSDFSAGGDSGSLIVTTGSCPQPVALLFAGSSTSTIGNPAGQVLDRLTTALGSTVSFVGACGSAAAAILEEQPGQLALDAVRRVTAIKERNENRLMSRDSVIGVGVGAADDNPTEAVIVVYVDETTGRTPRLPRRINGVRVKAVYTDPFVAF